MTEPRAEIDPPRKRVAVVCMALGVALSAISFVWPRLPFGGSEWTPELAQRHQAASARLHGLSHDYASELETAPVGALPRELSEARGEFTSLSQQLDDARSRPQRVATVLRIAGLGLSITGAAGYFWATRRSS